MNQKLLMRCPRGCEAVWSAYCQIAQARPAGMGAQGIPYTEIEAWQRLYGVRLSPWELDCLTEIDRRAVSRAAKKQEKETT